METSSLRKRIYRINYLRRWSIRCGHSHNLQSFHNAFVELNFYYSTSEDSTPVKYFELYHI